MLFSLLHTKLLCHNEGSSKQYDGCWNAQQQGEVRKAGRWWRGLHRLTVQEESTKGSIQGNCTGHIPVSHWLLTDKLRGSSSGGNHKGRASRTHHPRHHHRPARFPSRVLPFEDCLLRSQRLPGLLLRRHPGFWWLSWIKAAACRSIFSLPTCYVFSDCYCLLPGCLELNQLNLIVRRRLWLTQEGFMLEFSSVCSFFLFALLLFAEKPERSQIFVQLF